MNLRRRGSAANLRTSFLESQHHQLTLDTPILCMYVASRRCQLDFPLGLAPETGRRSRGADGDAFAFCFRLSMFAVSSRLNFDALRNVLRSTELASSRKR